MGLSLDASSLNRLKGQAATGADQDRVIRETAKQLESLFMQELMKSMRATTMGTGMLDNSATEMGTSMLDSQMSTQMSGLPGGLSEMIVRQLKQQMSAISGDTPDSELPDTELHPLSAVMNASSFHAQASMAQRERASEVAGAAQASPAQEPASIVRRTGGSSEEFVRKHQAAADAAEAATGIPAAHILGQAALESGWGKREIRMADGSSSHNLFGIKAGANWKGKVAEVTTTEYMGGVAHKVTAKFRAYDSYEDAFKDHARLLTQSPRYSQTVAQADTAAGYAKGLQKAGYATDPAYADKLTNVINTTLRVQRSVI